MMIALCVFFFKQKTAYEMRISDWSSDVCSSDLTVDYKIASDVKIYADWGIGFKSGGFNGGGTKAIVDGLFNQVFGSGINVSDVYKKEVNRSEEHTSELQSLMRISYAVFCLKKKTPKYNIKTSIHNMKHTQNI